MIETARESIRVLFYMFTEDKAGTRVLQALTEAARRGVAVRLLLDEFGCGAIRPGFLEPLRDAGGTYSVFHPTLSRRYLIRNHQKMVVADGSRAIIGGANINEHYLTDEGPKHWRDLWLAVDGPAVEKLADYFDDIENWTVHPKPLVKKLRRIIARHSRGSGPIAWRFSGPIARSNPWPVQIVKDILSAKRLDIVAAYFSPSNAMLRRIGGVSERGGEARLVTASKSDNNATIAATRFTYGRLLKRGVRVFEYQPAKFHTKLYIADDAVHIGSANFDFRSLYLNLEMMLRVEDAQFARAMRDYVDGEIANSIEITPAIHKAKATLWRKTKWALSNFLVTTMDYTVTRRINLGQE
ncbi:phosphatidylserine/phosphatidylglycerophosphate/cardiolipin synthase family protein [Sphingomonas sp. HDW15A]|uniref:phospholipase D-like domain-containing protein n=1 Tax=Sphingomonas sp. HDW15A TaxID=2714942 RepID=UPI0014081717|nr:phosphatidylserine/phosphatidylglycerophosphate/cardiolipin synthase family protein [Sphingomonas sp. HDW15A]QIK96849.1 phosphatidylserine/phosphatidylglycerophosphate/cardiolipin synthase family protein [Sphingomonas sp. HDW15A]